MLMLMLMRMRMLMLMLAVPRDANAQVNLATSTMCYFTSHPLSPHSKSHS
jgi:hypothetical protein